MWFVKENDGMKWVVDGHRIGLSIESVWLHINGGNPCTHNFFLICPDFKT